MSELQLRCQVVEDGPEPGGGQDHQNLPPRHEPAEGPRHADVLVDAEAEEKEHVASQGM